MKERLVPSTNYIALAIPFFLVLIGVELIVARARGRSVYRVQDALADLGCGVGQQVVAGLRGGGAARRLRLAPRARAAPLVRAGSGWPWVIAFVGVDLALLLVAPPVTRGEPALGGARRSPSGRGLQSRRRAAAGHPDDLHVLAVLPAPRAARRPDGRATRPPSRSPRSTSSGSTPSSSPKLGPLELVLNTPSHHRVHHAVNPQYLDKNYGGSAHRVGPALRHLPGGARACRVRHDEAAGSFDPAWAQVQTWFEIAEKARALPRWRDRARLWLASPAVDPLGRTAPGEAELRARPKYGVPISAALQAYAVVQFAPVVAATFFMLLGQATAPRGALAAGGVLVFSTLVALGGTPRRAAMGGPGRAGPARSRSRSGSWSCGRAQPGSRSPSRSWSGPSDGCSRRLPLSPALSPLARGVGGGAPGREILWRSSGRGR